MLPDVNGASGTVCLTNLRAKWRLGGRRRLVCSRMVIHLNSAHKLTHCLSISHICRQAVNYGHQLRLQVHLILSSWCSLSSWLRSSPNPGPASVCRLIGRIVWVTDWTTYWCIGCPNWMTVLAKSCQRPNVTNIASNPASQPELPPLPSPRFITLNALHVQHLGLGGNRGRQCGQGAPPLLRASVRGARAGTNVPLMQPTHGKRISHAIQSISLCQSQSFCHGLRVRLMRMDDVAEVAGSFLRWKRGRGVITLFADYNGATYCFYDSELRKLRHV